MKLELSLGICVGQHSAAGVKDENWDCLGIRVPNDSSLATKGIAAVLADGVSAASAGKEAAAICVQNFLGDYYSTPDSWQVKTSAQRVLTSLNRWLYSLTQSGGFEEEKGYISTICVVILKSRTAHLFHAGDSRIYRLRKGKLEQLTKDHDVQFNKTTRYLNRAMGLNVSLRVDYKTVELEQGDIFLTTTDGIHDFLSLEEMTSQLEAAESASELDTIAGNLAAQALLNESKDNLSCQIIRVDTLPAANRDESMRQLSELPFPPDLKAGDKLDGLEIIRTLTESPRSTLYLVRDPASQLEYVLKSPSVNFIDDPAYIERFAMEEWIGKRLEHRNLLKIISRPNERSAQYYLMEHIMGTRLSDWIEAYGKSPDIQEVIRIAGEIISGIRALHRKETIHQDLKPDNILLDRDGHVKIIDYGSSRIAGIDEISVNFDREVALGTVDYSAPEYRLNIDATTAADQFSIAMIIYHMLTGDRSPYGKKWEKANNLRDFSLLEYRPSYQIQPLVPLWMDQALEKALRINPSLRYDSLSEFLQDLKAPNPEFQRAKFQPLLERNPLLLWKSISLILFILLILSLVF